MRMQNELLASRAVVKSRYAVIPAEGIPISRMPQWPDARIYVLASPSLGANFVQYRMELDAGLSGTQPGDATTESFIYVLSGDLSLEIDQGRQTRTSLTAGGFALIPPGTSWGLHATSSADLTVVRKRYEAIPGHESYQPLVDNQEDRAGEVYMGDDGALLQTLIPDEVAYDMAMNIFTFESGHSLPVTETHVMEHGLIVLQGKGLYYLDDRWMEVEEGDFIWMGPYCPQSYYATGPSATRYLYYKNVNRDISV